jgi:hypothetical protein
VNDVVGGIACGATGSDAIGPEDVVSELGPEADVTVSGLEYGVAGGTWGFL